MPAARRGCDARLVGDLPLTNSMVKTRVLERAWLISGMWILPRTRLVRRPKFRRQRSAFWASSRKSSSCGRRSAQL